MAVAITLAKPAGLPVYPPHDEPGGDCLLLRLHNDQPWRREIAWPRGFEGGIAHRLDNDTSGAVLAADSLEELAAIRARFSRGTLEKTYLLRAAREVPWDRNVCDRPLAHHPRRKALMVVQRDRAGRTPHRGKWYPARTEFARLRPGLPIWKAVITTGVTHQVRAHAAFLGIPILGDRLYGGARHDPAIEPGGQPPERFLLHHRGLRDADGLATDPVPDPDWLYHS